MTQAAAFRTGFVHAEVNALKNGGISALIAQNPKQEGEVAMTAVSLHRLNIVA